LFTQSTTVLFSRAPSFADLHRVVGDARVVQRERGEVSWVCAEQSLVVPIRSPAEGFLEIDVQERPWPDAMGDPKTDLNLFGAWTMGFFGPLVFPGNLERACRQAFAFDGAPQVASRHGAFVRLRTSYAAGDPHAKIIPEGWDPMAELTLLVKLARRILDLPGALAYFDPNAEVILDAEGMAASLEHASRANVPPLDLLTHVRVFNLEGTDFALMDTVGMNRFFLPDAELALAGSIDPNDGARFLRNVSLHHLREKGPIPDGDTTDGPGGRYRVHHRKDSLVAPRRAVARFAPEFADPPEAFLSAGERA
jgi:hypothetical protein